MTSYAEVMPEQTFNDAGQKSASGTRCPFLDGETRRLKVTKRISCVERSALRREAGLGRRSCVPVDLVSGRRSGR